MYERPNGSAKLTFVREPMAGTVVTETPLYIHPVKELTDEEILEVKKTVDYNQFMTAGEYAFNVAKAILRKAQEK